MDATIRNCREALKPGGKLVLNVSDELEEPITSSRQVGT
jgi:precorrin-6B methylase 2